MKYLFLAVGVVFSGGLFGQLALAYEFTPLWNCPAGQEPIQYLEDQPGGQLCGVPTTACLRTGAPSTMYHFLCPARPSKNPQPCPPGQRLHVLPADDSPWIECGKPRPNCVPLDPPRNTIFDCRQEATSAPTYSAWPATPALKQSLPPIPGPTLFDQEPSELARQSFWQRVLTALTRLLGF